MNTELIPIIDQLIVKYQEAIKDVEQCDDFTNAIEKLRYVGPEWIGFNRYMSGGICYAMRGLKDYTLDLETKIAGLVFEDIHPDDKYISQYGKEFYGQAPCHLNKYPFEHYNMPEDLINICLKPRLERLEYIKSKLINSAE